MEGALRLVGDASRRCCGPSARRRGLGSPRTRARCAVRAAVALGGGAGPRHGRGGEALSGAGDDDAEEAAAQGGAMAMPTSDAATATVEVSPPAD